MTKHTPGPWTLETVPTSADSCHKIGPFPNRHDREGYACVYADNIRIGIDESLPRAQELLANARLIAAAPDLLEALQLIQGQGWQLHDDEFGNEIKRRCLSAIAKATATAA